ncbi:MAG: hypothetical protein WCT19_04255 [Candidatus Paceibacterota bacterium]
MDDELKWFIGFIGVFALLWFVGGGVNSSISQKPFIAADGTVYGNDPLPNLGKNNSGTNSVKIQPTTEDIASQLNNVQSNVNDIQKSINDIKIGQVFSPLQGSLTIEKVNPAYDSYYYQSQIIEGNKIPLMNQEYLVIRASSGNSGTVTLTGLVLKSVASGKSVTIGKAVPLPYSGVVNAAETVKLNPGETVYISSGYSPTGFSFRLNSCTGYFGQFQDFIPPLPLDCPAASLETMPSTPNKLEDSCLDFIDDLPVCKIVSDVPNYFRNDCKNFLSKLNYNNCVLNHRNSIDFYKPEWRIYLGRNELLWKSSRETINLLDQNGKVIDTKSY